MISSLVISFSYNLLVVYLGKLDHSEWSRFFLQYLWEFVLGIIVARNQLLPKVLSYNWLVYIIGFITSLSIALLFVVFLGGVGKILNDYFTFVGYLCGCILLYFLGKNFLTGVVKFISWIDTFSYSLFIIHILVLDFYRQVLMQRPLTLADLPLLLIAAFISALVFNKIINYALSFVTQSIKIV